MRTLGIATNNIGKYDLFKRMLFSLSPDINLVKINCHVNEINDISKNAEYKALFASKTVNFPVFSTDEALIFSHLDDPFQPGSRIKRIISSDPSDEQLVTYYSDLLLKLEPAQRSGKISTSIAFAIQGSLLSSSVLHQDCMFKIPPSKIRLPGRPLASLHYYPQYEKFYSELTESEKLSEDIGPLIEVIQFIAENAL